jgi:aminoglycoside 2''-phosphotransferase
MINDVVVVNEELVFRFPKNDYGRKASAGEVAVLRAVQPRVGVAIPDPFYAGADAIAYRRLPGETLSRELLLSLPSAAQQRLAEDLDVSLRGCTKHRWTTAAAHAGAVAARGLGGDVA